MFGSVQAVLAWMWCGRGVDPTSPTPVVGDRRAHCGVDVAGKHAVHCQGLVVEVALRCEPIKESRTASIALLLGL